LKCWDFRVENDAIVNTRIVIHFEEGIPIIRPLFATQASWVGGDFSGLKSLQLNVGHRANPSDAPIAAVGCLRNTALDACGQARLGGVTRGGLMSLAFLIVSLTWTDL